MISIFYFTTGKESQAKEPKEHTQLKHKKDLFDDLKSHSVMLYMILASVGIPAILIFVVYFEVGALQVSKEEGVHAKVW